MFSLLGLLDFRALVGSDYEDSKMFNFCTFGGLEDYEEGRVYTGNANYSRYILFWDGEVLLLLPFFLMSRSSIFLIREISTSGGRVSLTSFFFRNSDVSLSNF